MLLHLTMRKQIKLTFYVIIAVFNSILFSGSKFSPPGVSLITSQRQKFFLLLF